MKKYLLLAVAAGSLAFVGCGGEEPKPADPVKPAAPKADKPADAPKAPAAPEAPKK